MSHPSPAAKRSWIREIGRGERAPKALLYKHYALIRLLSMFNSTSRLDEDAWGWLSMAVVTM